MSNEHFIRKNLNVWSDILKEENLCETLNKIDFVKNKEETEPNLRGVESYEYVNESLNDFFESNASSSKSSKRKFHKKMKNHRNKSDFNLNRAISNNNETNVPSDKCINNRMIVHKELKEIKERLGPVIFFDESKRRDHIHVSELDSDEMVIKEIAKQLREPKVEIICMILVFFLNFHGKGWLN